MENIDFFVKHGYLLTIEMKYNMVNAKVVRSIERSGLYTVVRRSTNLVRALQELDDVLATHRHELNTVLAIENHHRSAR